MWILIIVLKIIPVKKLFLNIDGGESYQQKPNKP
jgi:hypothetical protein